MSLKQKTVPYEKYILVDWKSGDRSVVNVKQVLSPSNQELKAGVMVTLERGDKKERATVIGTSRDPDILERQIFREPDSNYPNKQEIEEDFSASASSWSPSDETSDSDSEEDVKPKKIYVPLLNESKGRRRNSKKVMTPVHRPPAIIPNNLQPKILNGTIDNVNKRETILHHVIAKHKPKKSKSKLLRNIKAINVAFKKLIGIVDNMKLMMDIDDKEKTQSNQSKLKDFKLENKNQSDVNDEENAPSDNEYFENEFNRSDDNVLITNKYDLATNEEDDIVETHKNVREISNILKQTENKGKTATNLKFDDDIITKQKQTKDVNKFTHHPQENKKNMKEQKVSKQTKMFSNSKHQKDNDKIGPDWIPIGSGATKIHITKFRNVKWKSYTVATRTLLLAVFPRKTLATHSLTGKRSPAFQNKPAKMCLDPKVVSDVLIEITDRFNVKENLVRSIITTKCADECKMYKSRLMRKTMAVPNDQENVPPNTSQVATENLNINQTM